MTHRVTAVLSLLCHHLKLLQACTQRVIVNWTVDFTRSVLDSAMLFQKAFRSLNDAELGAISEFLPQMQSAFLHLSLSNIQSDDLRHAFDRLIQILMKNPHLSEVHRSCIFEYCLDHSVEVPKVQVVPDSVLRAPPWLLSWIECRLFVQRLTELDDRDQLWPFLDSCFVLDPDYLCYLLISVLAYLVPENRQQLTRRVVDWLMYAVTRSNQARISLVKQDPVRIRDMCIALPALFRPVLVVFDPKDPIQVHNGEPSTTQVTDFLCCLMTVGQNPCHVLEPLSKLASMEPSSQTFWKTVLQSVTMKCSAK